jgi:hypothetical protein
MSNRYFLGPYHLDRRRGRQLRADVWNDLTKLRRVRELVHAAPRAWLDRKLAELEDDLTRQHSLLATVFPTKSEAQEQWLNSLPLTDEE